MTTITDQQFIDTAKQLACQVSAVKAVYEVETNGSGYLPDGRVKILFEGHVFWQQLERGGKKPANILKQNPQYSNILYQKWTKKNYIGGAGEWDRWSKAIELCKKYNVPVIAALNSASYGCFQVMGFNAILCGYDDAQAMIVAFNNGGEYEHLKAFTKYIRAVKLDDELREKNWTAFAYKYNGPGYKGNLNIDWDDYDLKLAAADKKYQ